MSYEEQKEYFELGIRPYRTRPTDRQYGDNWECCFCGFEGHTHNRGRPQKHAHLVHNTSHKIMRYDEYAKTMKVPKHRPADPSHLPKIYTLQTYPLRDIEPMPSLDDIFKLCSSLMSVRLTGLFLFETSCIDANFKLDLVKMNFRITSMTDEDCETANIDDIYGILVRYLNGYASKLSKEDRATLKAVVSLLTPTKSGERSLSCIGTAVSILK